MASQERQWQQVAMDSKFGGINKLAKCEQRG